MAIKVETQFEPGTLKAYASNETEMKLFLSNDDNGTYWCECDVAVASPLSLAHDRELNLARARIGILKPNDRKEKRVKIYTRPNNFPDEYKLNITTYVYGEDGAIVERKEDGAAIECKEQQV